MIKKVIFCISLFLLVSCSGGGVTKNDLVTTCSMVSSDYIDSQLKKGIFNVDPRFESLIIVLREKNGITDHSQFTLYNTSDYIYKNIALRAINRSNENGTYPNFYLECILKLSEEFEVD